MKAIWIVCALSIGLPAAGHGQAGGGRSMTFLNTPGIAKLSALGGINISNVHDNAGMYLYNPALLQTHHHNVFAIHHTFYFADIQLNTLAYALDLGKLGMWSAGLIYMNYGLLDGFDDTGMETGGFSVADYAISLGHSHTSGAFTAGINVKLASSRLAGFDASALLADLGVIFVHPLHDLTLGLTLRNAGVVLRDFTASSESRLPMDLILGSSFKPTHMPFRFSLNLHQLHRLGSYYPGFRQSGSPQEEPGILDLALRHLVVGTELLLSDNFNLRMGYNHRMRQELRLPETAGGAGLAYGMHFKWRGAAFDLSRMHFHAAGALTQLGLNIDFKKGFKRSTVTKENNDNTE